MGRTVPRPAPRTARPARATLAVRLALPLLALVAGSARAEPPRLYGQPPAGPRRVVTVAPSLTEIVLDLGLGDRLAGVSRYDDAPEVASLPRVGGFTDPSPEAILALEPDLILAAPSPGNQGPVLRLARLGIPVLLLPLHRLPEILGSVREAARVLGVPARGEALAARIASDLEAEQARTGGLPSKRVLVVFTWQPLVVAGPGSFADALLADAGAVNAAAGASGMYPTFSAEAALAAAPELVIDATGSHGGGDPPPGLKSRIVRVESTALFRPGPRIVEALRELIAVVHPEAGPAARAPATAPGPAGSCRSVAAECRPPDALFVGPGNPRAPFAPEGRAGTPSAGATDAAPHRGAGSAGP